MSEFWFGVLQVALLMPAIILHEVAHGYASYRLGDPTAKARGRITLNPLAHIDPVGSLLLPALLWLGGLPVFGYAKPVPINPHYYRDYRKGMVISGLAGPATNLTLAVAAGLGARGVDAIAMATGGESVALGWVWTVLFLFCTINLVLLFFNLIPIPPLDGSRVLPLFLSDRALMKYHEFERYGILIFFAVVLLLPRLLGFSVIGAYFDVTVDPVLRLLTGASWGA